MVHFVSQKKTALCFTSIRILTQWGNKVASPPRFPLCARACVSVCAGVLGVTVCHVSQRLLPSTFIDFHLNGWRSLCAQCCWYLWFCKRPKVTKNKSAACQNIQKNKRQPQTKIQEMSQQFTLGPFIQIPALDCFVIRTRSHGRKCIKKIDIVFGWLQLHDPWELITNTGSIMKKNGKGFMIFITKNCHFILQWIKIKLEFTCKKWEAH